MSARVLPDTLWRPVGLCVATNRLEEPRMKLFHTSPAPPGKDMSAELVAGSAVLDTAHVGDIVGALGTIRQDDDRGQRSLRQRLRLLLVIMGPGLVVMIGDNDAGGVSTYSQAGQDYGTKLLWTLALLVPVLYLNQEMVVRLGAVSGVGHARLILARFGRFWGAFSVADLFILNGLTIVTEFIGVSLALGYFGIGKAIGVPIAAVLLLLVAGSGGFRRYERAMFALILPLNVGMIALFFLSHPQGARVLHDTVVPSLPGGLNSTLLLLITAIVGTTVAPWQLFFQQSNVVDKRITPRYIPYERVDTAIGVVFVISGAAILMCAAAFGLFHTPLGGHFVDAGQVAHGLHDRVGSVAGTIFALSLLDLSLIGAIAVTLSTAYTFGDVMKVRHSLHWTPKQAPLFYGGYAALVAASAAVVLIPHAPLGTITVGVQALAGILLPSATVFLLLLCNDHQVLGPWVNTTTRNVLTAIVVWVLVLLSLALTAATLFGNISGHTLIAGFSAGLAVAVASLGALGIQRTLRHRRDYVDTGLRDAWLELRLRRNGRRTALKGERAAWRTPPLRTLERPVLSRSRVTGLLVLRGYLVVALGLAIVKIIRIALTG
jgi:Mn2+/Fe2+ NRAMP family transporter